MAAALDAIGTPTFRVIKGPQDSFVEAVNALYSKRSAQDVLLLAADAGTEESSHSLEEYPAEDLYLLHPVGEGLIGARNALFEPSHPEEAAAVGMTPLKGIRVPAAATAIALLDFEASPEPSLAEAEASRPGLQADVAEEAGRQVTEWGRNNILFLDTSDSFPSDRQRPERCRAAKSLWRDENPMFDLPVRMLISYDLHGWQDTWYPTTYMGGRTLGIQRPTWVAKTLDSIAELAHFPRRSKLVC